MPRDQAVLLTKRDFRLLPKSKLDAVVASSDNISSSFFWRRQSPRNAGPVPPSTSDVEGDPSPSSICFDLTLAPKLNPRLPPGAASAVPKPPSKQDQIACGSYTIGGTFVHRQQGVTHTDVASAAASHMLQEMFLHEQLERLRSVTTARYDLYDGGYDTMQALVESLQAIYNSIDPSQEALKVLAGATFRSVAAGLYFDKKASVSPRHATAPAGSSRSVDALTNYASVATDKRCVLPTTVVSHKLHCIEIENELAHERHRLAQIKAHFAELQATLRKYEGQAKKDPHDSSHSNDPQIEGQLGTPGSARHTTTTATAHAPAHSFPATAAAAGGGGGSAGNRQLDVSLDPSGSHGRMQLVLDEVQHLRDILVDKEDIISRKTNEIMYLQGKCNELQRLLSQNMDTTLDFAARYKQTIEKTTGHVAPMLLDGRTAEQVAWQSNMDIAKLFGMPVLGLVAVPPAGPAAGSDASSTDSAAGAPPVRVTSACRTGAVVYTDNLSLEEKLHVMRQAAVPQSPPVE